jgi:phosphonatase-like hydrolase
MGASKREVIRHFVEHERTRIRPIPGAASTFAWCRERGIQLATTTGFYGEIRDLILDLCGWRDLFAANVSSSDVKRGRPAPFMIFRAMEASGMEDVRQVVNVGDTPLGLQAGPNAGVRGVVGVLTGSQGEERLKREPHTHLLPSVTELPSLIAREL